MDLDLHRSDARGRSHELDRMTGSAQRASEFLKALAHESLVSTRRDGKIIYYSLASDDARTVIGAIYDVFCRKARRR